MEHKMYVKGTESMWMPVEQFKDNYYVRLHNPSYHSYRETHFSIWRRDVKFWQSMEREK